MSASEPIPTPPPSPAKQRRSVPWYEQSALAQLTLARLREFLREPGAVFWVFGFPVLMVVALGFAFRNTPTPMPHVGVTPNVPQWALAALTDKLFVVERLSEQGEGEKCLAKGRCDLVLSPTANLYTELSFAFDPQRPEAVVARLAVEKALTHARFPSATVSVSEHPLSVRGRRYVDFLLPGIIGLNLMSSSMWGIGYSIVVSRKRNLLRRFAASPLRRSHFLGAYALSRLVFLTFELAALLLFGSLAFDVTVQGSLFSFLFLSLFGAASFACVSLVIAARISTIEAANGWLNFLMLPMWVLSGSFFSYERFPQLVHPLIQALPLTALNDGLRAITNDAAPLITLWPQVTVLAVWGLVSFVLALRWFRWQ